VGRTLVRLFRGDYDGDGVTLASTPDDWPLGILIVGGFLVLSKGYGPGFNCAADADGDHKLEIAVYQPSTTRWLALKSTAVHRATAGRARRPTIACCRLRSSRVVARASGGRFRRRFHRDITVYNTTSGMVRSQRAAAASATNRAGAGQAHTVPGDMTVTARAISPSTINRYD
jgi:hypothetical protein